MTCSPTPTRFATQTGGNRSTRTCIRNSFHRVNPMGTTKFVFIGSRRHPDDPQGRLLEADRTAPEEQRWHYHHSPAILDEGTDHESALWPTSHEFDLAGLRRIRDEKITNGVQWEWACNFQNDPVGSPDMLAFDPAWFDPAKMFYSDPVESLPPAKFKVISFDPSMGAGTETSDFFAAVYLHITDDGTIYVDDSWLAVAKPDMIVAAASELVARHQDCHLIPFESNAGGIYCAELIKRELDRRGLAFPVVFKTYSGTSGDEKICRITLNLWDIISKGKLHLRKPPGIESSSVSFADFRPKRLTAPMLLRPALSHSRRFCDDERDKGKGGEMTPMDALLADARQTALWPGRTISWFSCGAASAVASKLAHDARPDTLVIYHDLHESEHPDNARFLADVEQWIGTKILRTRHPKYGGDVNAVFEHERYLVGRHGAPCTAP